MMHRKDNGTGSRAPLIGGTSSSRGNGGGKLIAAMMAAAALTLLGAVGLIANVASPGKKTDPSATAEASIEDVSAERSYPLPDRRFRSAGFADPVR